MSNRRTLIGITFRHSREQGKREVVAAFERAGGAISKVAQEFELTQRQVERIVRREGLAAAVRRVRLEFGMLKTFSPKQPRVLTLLERGRLALRRKS